MYPKPQLMQIIIQDLSIIKTYGQLKFQSEAQAATKRGFIVFIILAVATMAPLKLFIGCFNLNGHLIP